MLPVFLCVVLLSASAIGSPLPDEDSSSSSSLECQYTKKDGTEVPLEAIFKALRGDVETDGDEEKIYYEKFIDLITTERGEKLQLTIDGFATTWKAVMDKADYDTGMLHCAYFQMADNCTESGNSFDDDYLTVDTTEEGMENTDGTEDEARCAFNFMAGYKVGNTGTAPDYVTMSSYCDTMKTLMDKMAAAAEAGSTGNPCLVNNANAST